MFRTHNCGQLSIENINENIILCGWIYKIRKYKKIIFIDLKDFYGITQIIINKKYNDLKINYLIKIKGIVKKRKFNNSKLQTGDIEIIVNNIFILNKNFLDIYKFNKNDLLNNRYINFRNNDFFKIIMLKNRMLFLIRNYLYKKKIMEIDTPILSNYFSKGGSTLFNVKVNGKKIYELVQSPQIFKQLLIIGGIDKYYQIAKCFRNESYRQDRQIEFHQIDFEFSFIKKKEIIKFSKKFINYIFINIFKKNIKKFQFITYNKVIKKYGTDKPNLFFNIKIRKIIKKNIYLYFKINIIKYIINIKNLLFIINKCNILKKELIYLVYKNKNYINKKLKKILNFKKKYVYIVFKYINKIIYLKIGQLINEIIFFLKKNIIYNKYYPIWILDYPLFKNKNNKYICFHNPFTSPKNLNNITYKSKSKSYDLVINGIEIASGSIRINNYKIQNLIFHMLKYKKKKIKKYFYYILNALKFSAPPHGGIAFGFERILSLIFNKDIYNIIPFPKKKI
ncbi:MAG: amino acid--tRNA ligase-related protein [Candidatus Shikimatogenerans sp. AspAUS03]|uniref:Amino acid--tRNA ligase-related protein n=1 Tax=Candidatus Shikimatogenerans sp. AspAUS03 TaxID=3158563 RepID=A0AAU7QU84_9FLAO